MDQLLYQFLFFTGIAFWVALLIWLFLRWRHEKKWLFKTGLYLIETRLNALTFNL